MCVEVGTRIGVLTKQGASVLDNVPDTFYYIPLIKQLEVLLQNDSIRSQV